MVNDNIVLIGVLAVLLVCLVVLAYKLKVAVSEKERALFELAALTEKYSVIVDADAEAKLIVSAAQRQNDEILESIDISKRNLQNEEAKIGELRSIYAEKKKLFDTLVEQLAIYDDRLSFAELGVYEPHFDFETSEYYKAEIEFVRGQQKEMVQLKTAVICHTNWSVDGSLSKGKTMTDRNIRLTLRAFNNECDAAISNIRWNNANAMEKRIANARLQIDKSNQSNRVEITDSYFELKMKELRLVHECRAKVREERESRAEIARAEREEQKLRREMEEAEREEAKFQKMLEKARSEAAAAVGGRQEAYVQKVEELERQLAEARAKFERAQAMAERTKTGYVYIISNIGSFGPDFVKIGLTRRLDPTDRVRELGDASVPFEFDTHAIIYSEDAPTLERALHNEFADARVNATNFRKEFFRVTLDDVEAAVRRLAPEVSFFKDIEAQEYHETLALRKLKLESQMYAGTDVFPEAI